MTGSRSRLLQLYYLATPVFGLSDWLWGLNVRVAFLDDWPLGRTLYYAIGTALGVVISARPGAAALVGLLESSVNIGLLVVSVLLWYLRILDAAASETLLPEPVTPEAVANFVLVALMLGVSHTMRSAAALRRP